MGNCTVIQKQSRNQTEVEETLCYGYDKLGRLIQVSQNQSLIREYQYDALGNRTKKWEKGQETWYNNRKIEPPYPVTLVCKKGTEEELLYEVTTKDLHYEYRVSTLPVTVEIEGETKYLLTDHLGSVLRILNQEGKTEQVYEYDEYGNALLEEPQYVGYAGYPVTGNGTYAAGRRFYDSEQGRFLSRDLWFGNLGEPQTYNRYLYAVDNPIRYRDASGMSPTESALLKNPFEKETKEFSFPTDMNQAVAETTSGIHKGRITEPIYQETGLDWLEKSVDWLMDTPYGDALSDSFFFMNPSFVVSGYLKGMLIDGKSGEEVTQEFIEHSRGFHGSLIKTIPKQLYGIVTFPDKVEAEIDEIRNLFQCTNQTGISRVFYTGNEYLNRKLDLIENGIMGTVYAYLNGDARTKGEIEGKLFFGIAEITATQPMANKPMENKAMVTPPMVNKPVKLDGVDDKQTIQTIEEQKQADIEELCLLLLYEKDLTGSEKIHRDTLINRLFKEGDIPKIRAVEEKLSKKGNSKWTQSERSFMEQVQRYGTEEEKTELDTIEGTGNGGDKSPIGSTVEFKQKYGNTINKLAEELGVSPNMLAAVILVESSGSGFVDGNLKIRFENHYFLKRTSGYEDLFTYDWKTHAFRTSVDEEWSKVHTVKQSSEYAAFNFALSLNEEAAYQSISMGLGQIMGGNFTACEYSSAKEMYEEFSRGHEQQIEGMATFFKNYNKGSTLRALQDGDLATFVSQYNGNGQVSTYTKLMNDRMEEYKNAK